jgi:hypothetical protein
LDVIKELQGEFDGYTSDNEEEDFIDRLGVDIKDLTHKLTFCGEENEK